MCHHQNIGKSSLVHIYLSRENDLRAAPHGTEHRTGTVNEMYSFY